MKVLTRENVFSFQASKVLCEFKDRYAINLFGVINVLGSKTDRNPKMVLI